MEMWYGLGRPVHHGPRDPRRAAGGALMARDGRRLRVLLLFGGRSAEHDVSCVTAVAVAPRARPRTLRGRARSRSRPTVGGCSPARRGAALEKGATALPVAFAVEGEPVRPPSGPVAPEIVPRSSAPSSAGLDSTSCSRCCTALRRGRHRAGPARARRPAVRRLGRARLGGRDGQGHDEARVRGRGVAARRATSTLRDGHDVDAFAARVEAELGLPVLRQAGEHGLVGRA